MKSETNHTPTIESRVASAILEKPVGEIELDGKTYPIAPPTIATLILVSEIVSTLPEVAPVPADQILHSVLRHAKDFRPLGDLAATLILGAKGLTETVTRTVERKRLFGLVKTRREETVTIDRKAELAKAILENVRPSVLRDIVIRRLTDLEIGDFFGITTSLAAANLLKSTREVGH